MQKGISIHALREEGDAQRWTKRSLVIRFLSTPSARRATLPGGDQIWPGEISIHALREEGDDYFAPSSGLQGHFYPRPPRGGRLYKRWLRDVLVSISIHALREEGDTGMHLVVLFIK